MTTTAGTPATHRHRSPHLQGSTWLQDSTHLDIRTLKPGDYDTLTTTAPDVPDLTSRPVPPGCRS